VEAQDCALRPADVDLGSALPASARGRHAYTFSRENTSCGYAGVDTRYDWTAPESGTFVIDTAGSAYAVTLAVRRGPCEADEVSCDVNRNGSGYTSRAVVSLEAGERIRIVVDGGALRTLDHVVYIQRAASEDCSNGHDDDGDGALDCIDTDCAGAPACEPRACAAVDLGGEVPVALDGRTDDEHGRFPRSCDSGGFNPSRAHVFTPPRSGLYTLRAAAFPGSDTRVELSVLAGCGGPELACAASGWLPQEVQLELQAGVPILVVVRASYWSADVGGGWGSVYRLSITGPGA